MKTCQKLSCLFPRLFISQMMCGLRRLRESKSLVKAPVVGTTSSRGQLQAARLRDKASASTPYEYSLSHFCLRNYLIAEKQLWIIDGCAFCSDLNNGKANLTHVSIVFCPPSHASKDVASLLCFPVFTSSFSLFPLFFLTPSPTATTTTCFQQASPWTRTVWFILSMAPPSERWTRTASFPLSSVPTTWHRHVLWPVTAAWISIRWLKQRCARKLLTGQ